MKQSKEGGTQEVFAINTPPFLSGLKRDPLRGSKAATTSNKRGGEKKWPTGEKVEMGLPLRLIAFPVVLPLLPQLGAQDDSLKATTISHSKT